MSGSEQPGRFMDQVGEKGSRLKTIMQESEESRDKSQYQGLSREDEYTNSEGRRGDELHCYPSTSDGAVPKKTIAELQSKFHERFLQSARDEGRSYPPCQRVDCKPDQIPSKSFSTFKPLSEFSRRSSRLREGNSSNWDSDVSSGTDGTPNRSSDVNSPTVEKSYWREAGALYKDNKEHSQAHSFASQNFTSDVEHIKQHISRENISFVRFEATDLHGVSRSKTVPARFFHEKAVYGISMPRSYLELTLSPRVNETDHSSSPNFSSDILLVPDLSSFQILPWADQTARLICDPCTITGIPLRTSPRLIAKQMLSQLQSMGFSLHSSFTYECCIFGDPERVGPKSVFFPATTLLSTYDLPFLQQLVRGMYYMGVDVESFSSANGPGQMEICFKPRFGIEAADSAFTFRTGIKEMARKYDYIATFFTDDSIHNCGLLSHSLWDASGKRSLFHVDNGELSEIGKKWLSGLLHHSAALSCLLAPEIGCENQLARAKKDSMHQLYATCGCNDNSCTFNVKVHGGRETHIENKLGSAMANPYIVLAATVAAGLDGIRRNLNTDQILNRASVQQKHFPVPVKLEDALEALADDSVIRVALGEPFVQYFIAMKRIEIETQEQDTDKNKGLEYFI
ncbi:Lengsin Glutamate-ammonia ligase domain-containing protein 1 [Triplophysa tibetana]|uniref:Lengsin n=1 Tax=Triplophysa tibetana TaxID=1572043 RepID=A0A5A9NEQ0_9TELE|nr:Lengsin Glutamate-ammonia ligase domain-containing protein 1 [Triplophysa tibetana]